MLLHNCGTRVLNKTKRFISPQQLETTTPEYVETYIAGAANRMHIAASAISAPGQAMAATTEAAKAIIELVNNMAATVVVIEYFL